MTRWLVLALLCAGAMPSCQSGGDPRSDGEIDGGNGAAPFPEGGVVPLAVDFTVGSCPLLEPGPRCRGRAPLTVELVPISAGEVTRFLWSFGDGTPTSTDRIPRHTYAIPGSYDVRLVAGRGADEIASRTRAGFVLVVENQAGDPCEVDVQCAAGLSCICGSAANCSPAFSRGLCASSCPQGVCPADQVCADLTASAALAGRDAPWRQPLCVKTCAGDQDCAAGLHCRDLPGRAGGWVRGCFPEHPASAGEPCRNASGELRPELCLGGQCADLGSQGVCAPACTNSPCPSGTGCVEIPDLGRLCLPSCGATMACDRDLLLACSPPHPGGLGFTPTEGAPAGEYCAPRRCRTDDDCGPAGVCHDDSQGHCVRRPG